MAHQSPAQATDMLLKLSPALQPRTVFCLARKTFSTRPHLATSPRRSLEVVAQGRRGFSELLNLSGGNKTPPSADKRAPLKPGVVSPPLAVPDHIPRPCYAATGQMPPWDNEPQIHKGEGLQKMRAACKLAAEVLNYAGTLVKPGVTTDEIDRAVHAMIIENGAYPSPLNYGNFPKSVCTSVNECICHGIPDSRPLKEGDILNIDVTVYLQGYHGDTSRMFRVGNVSAPAERLCMAVTEALEAGIAVCGPGKPIRAIGAAIHDVADKYKYATCKTFVGHGVGFAFHSFPQVLHFRNMEPGVMVPGMTFTIEPMLCEGSGKERFWKDGWTAVTVDGGLSAQQEHTLLITDTGVEVLTRA